MSKDVKALSISFRSDDGCIEHNNRDFFTENVDKSRTPNNTTYIKRDLRELYHELFDEALAEYNARQDRPDRQIPDYYEHIRKGKKEKLFQEIIVMFGNSENCGVGSENWETAVKLLDEYMREFEKRNPNLKVFNAVISCIAFIFLLYHFSRFVKGFLEMPCYNLWDILINLFIEFCFA